TILYGIDPSQWVTVQAPEIFPGWYDSTVSGEFSELRDPVGITTDSGGNGYNSEGYYHLIIAGNGMQISPARHGSGAPGATNTPPVLGLDPSSGFYPNGVTITISASNSVSGFSRDTSLFYRLDGLDPQQTDTEIPISNDGRARLTLGGPIDLANLRVRAF